MMSYRTQQDNCTDIFILVKFMIAQIVKIVKMQNADIMLAILF